MHDWVVQVSRLLSRIRCLREERDRGLKEIVVRRGFYAMICVGMYVQLSPACRIDFG